MDPNTLDPTGTTGKVVGFWVIVLTILKIGIPAFGLGCLVFYLVRRWLKKNQTPSTPPAPAPTPEKGVT